MTVPRVESAAWSGSPPDRDLEESADRHLLSGPKEMRGSTTTISLVSYRGFLSRAFSGKVEESLRLRFLGLATFWLVALALAWVGGNPWTWLGGGIATTCGYAFSWYRRNLDLGIWTVLMALMVVGLAFIMRSEMLAALDGHWLPLAHFLLLVQAIASFDIRTLGGLYAGIGLSGIVLFFASQQAFELSFGVFLLVYAGLLLAFFAVAFLEDETKIAQVRSAMSRLAILGFWSAVAVAVILLSVGAFLLLPRGESNAVGYQQVSALPITGNAGDPGTQALAMGTQPLTDFPGLSQSGRAPTQVMDGEVDQTPGDFQLGPSDVSGSPSEQEVILGDGTFPISSMSDDGDDVVMHVRSPVVSYWRGQVFETFDGTRWSPGHNRGPSRGAAYRAEDQLRYTQTFFINQDSPESTFMGYHGVDVRSPEDAVYRRSLGKGTSYQVVSVDPQLVPEALRHDRTPRGLDAQYYMVPASAHRLYGLAGRIVAGAETDFDRVVRIVDYLRRNGEYDASALNQLESSAHLDTFLFEGEAGSAVDFATATVMLARAAGLPARLATGYLPGERDLLSGAYRVRERDAHAWTEVYFQDHGWVPFDATPRPDIIAAGRARGGQLTGLKYLFESGVGDDLLRAAVRGPSKLTEGLRDAFSGPGSMAIAVVAAGAMLVSLGWLGARLLGRGRRPAGKEWSYARLPGEGRGELMGIYRRVEKLLRKRGVVARRPGQTLREYAATASGLDGGAEAELTWFTRAVWSTAYDPEWGSRISPEDSVQEAKARLASLKAALG